MAAILGTSCSIRTSHKAQPRKAGVLYIFIVPLHGTFLNGSHSNKIAGPPLRSLHMCKAGLSLTRVLYQFKISKYIKRLMVW